MKRFIISAALALALTACQTGPFTQASSVEARNGQIAVAVQEVTNARKALTALTVAKKISVDQYVTGQTALSEVSKKLATAQTLNLTDPAQAAQLIADALNALAVIQGASK